MEKKKLKKLVLNKEEIVNLNDYEQSRVKGGTGWGTVFVASMIYSATAKQNTWWPAKYDCDKKGYYYGGGYDGDNDDILKCDECFCTGPGGMHDQASGKFMLCYYTEEERHYFGDYYCSDAKYSGMTCVRSSGY